MGNTPLIGYKVVCDVRNTNDFKLCFWFTAGLRRKYSAMLSTWFVLKHIKHIHNIKSLIFTTGN